MRRHRRWSGISAAAGLLALLPVAASGAPVAGAEFSDTIATLALDGGLDARGRLGGLAVDRLDFLYVANFRDAVWRVSPEGEVQTLTRSAYGSSGVAVDSRGDVLHGNFFADTLTRIRRTGEIETFASGLDGPVGIAIAADDTVFVCNCSGNRLSRVSVAGEVASLAESELFACPNGITFGGDGALYVTNFNNHNILRVSTEGEVSRFATVGAGAGNAHIVYSKGFFYLTEILAHRVVKISETGEVTPVAGSGRPGHEDGPALSASLYHPNGIAVTAKGDILYVNTVVGEYQRPQRSRISVRRVELVTLTEVLDEAFERGGHEAVRDSYRRYKDDPVRGREETVGEMIAYGYSLLSNRKIAEALVVFELNAGSYPLSPAAQYQLGEANRYAGRTERAIGQYEKVLAIDPEHRDARSRLAQLRGHVGSI